MTERPLVGIGVLIRKNDEYLLTKRRNSHGDGTWSPPGGHLEFGESFEECAIRETLEETSLIIDDLVFLGVSNDFFEVENKHYITIWMEATSIDGEAIINSPDEMSEIAWFKRDQLPAPLFLPMEKLITNEFYRSG
jgi:8-oxo-dGTP diphosphatase